MTRKLKLLFLCALCTTSLICTAQDVIYTVSAVHNGETIRLDSILIDNRTGINSLLFRDLPDSDAYEINLTKGSVTGMAEITAMSQKPFTQTQNSDGILSVNFNGAKAEPITVRVFDAVGRQLYVTTRMATAQSSLQITLSGNGIYLVSFQTAGASAATFKARGSSRYSSFDLTTVQGLQAIRQNTADAETTPATLRVSTASKDENTEEDVFVEGDELMIFGFKDGYVITPFRIWFEADEKVVLQSKTFDEAYTNTTITLDFPIGNVVDLANYKIVTFDYSIPVSSLQLSPSKLKSSAYTLALPNGNLPILNGTGVQLVSVQNQIGTTIMQGLIDKTESVGYSMDAESTALSELILNPLFVNYSRDIVKMLENQLRELSAFTTYKNNVAALIAQAESQPMCASLDFTAPETGYGQVIFEYIETYMLDSNVEQSFVEPPVFSDWDYSDKVKYKIVNRGKRTIHIYANRQWTQGQQNVFIKEPEMIWSQKETGEEDTHFGFVRLSSDKLNYWSTVRGTFWDGWILGGEIPNYIFKSETKDIELDLEGANRLELEVWGLGKPHKPFSEFNDDEILKLALVTIDGVYTDVISPVIELVTGIESEVPSKQDGGWDFRYGTRKHAVSELCHLLGEAYVKDAANINSLKNNIMAGKPLNIILDVSSFIMNYIYDEIQKDIVNPTREAKFLNLMYNSLKQVSGITKTPDAFRAGLKNQVNNLKRYVGIGSKTISILQSVGDLAGTCYYTLNSDTKESFYHSFKRIILDPSQLQIMPGETKEVSILGDAVSASHSVVIDNPAVCTAQVNEDGTKLTVTGLTNGKAKITLTDNSGSNNMAGKLEVSCRNICYPDLKLSKTTVYAPLLQYTSVTVAAGSGNYSAVSLNQNIIASYEIKTENGNIVFRPRIGVSTGSIGTILVTDKITEQTQRLTVIIGNDPNVSYSYSSDFNDNVFDSNFWIKDLGSNNDNDIRVEDGVMKLEQNLTDVRTDLVSKEIPFISLFEIERDVFLHNANNYFGPAISFYFNNSTVQLHFWYDIDDYDNFYGIHIGYYNYTPHSGERYIKVNEQIITNKWFHEKIVVNKNGKVQYYLNGSFVGEYNIYDYEALRFIKEATTFRVRFNPYGWWTGHKHYFDNFSININ